MPRFNAIRSMFGLPEMTDEREAAIEAAQQDPELLDKVSAQKSDRITNKFGPELPPVTVEEEAMGNAAIGGAGGSIGSIGGINRGRGLASAFKNKAAQEKYLKQLGEFNPTPKTHTAEKFNKLRELYDEAIKRPGISADKKQEMLRQLKEEERLTKLRGYKISE